MIRALFLSVSLLITACQTTKEFSAPPVAQKFIGTFQFAGLSIPLPEGEWEVTGSRSFRGTLSDYGGGGSGSIYTELILGNVERVDGIYVAFNRDSGISIGRQGFLKSKFCERKNVLHIHRVSNTEGEKQECWGVNHVRTGFSSNLSVVRVFGTEVCLI
jgi:hypothetical protein